MGSVAYLSNANEKQNGDEELKARLEGAQQL